MATVAALYVRADSIYKKMPDVDAWDRDRDARNYSSGLPVVAHPPCAQWGILRAFAHDKPQEKALAPLAVRQVRENGGVLEHPKGSKLWEAERLPPPGEGADSFGGWTLPVSQKWWGHKAEKLTLLYIVGCRPGNIPPIEYQMGEAQCVVGSSRNKRHLKEISKADRERTPPAFAAWLCELAKRCRK